MKRIFYILLLLSQLFFAQDGFEEGNDYYKNGKYKQAINAYNSVLSAKKQSAELYFNLGNCYYKLNKVAPAIYNYEKALVLNPNDADILNNLKFAQKRTVDEIENLPKVGFSHLIRDFTSIYHYNSWARIAVSFSVLFLVCFLVYYFSASYKRLFFFAMFIMWVFVAVSISSAISEKRYFKNERPAIVFAETTEVKSDPQKTAAVVVVLHEGTKVYVKEKVDKWKKIQLTDGTEGWIDKQAITEVKK